MACYIKIVRLSDNKDYMFKSNTFNPGYFSFDPFIEIKGNDILQEIEKYIYDDDFKIQVHEDLVDFIKPNDKYMFFYDSYAYLSI